MKNTARLLAHLFALGLILSAPTLTSCGDDGGGSALKLRLQMYSPPSGYADPYEGVAYLQVTVEAPGRDARPVLYDFADKTAQIDDIPYGEDVRFTVEGLNQLCRPMAGVDPSQCVDATACATPGGPCAWGPGDVVARGRSLRMDVSDDIEPRIVPVYMMGLDSYAPTTSAQRNAPTQLGTGRIGFTATELEDGRVLIVGGATLGGGSDDLTDPAALGEIYRSAEIYDPEWGEFTSLSDAGDAGMLFQPRAFHQAVRLPNPDGPDRVAIFGGYSRVNGELMPIASVEVFDPVTGTFSQQAPAMLKARSYHTATLANDTGRVLLVGGYEGGDGASGSWEVWDPARGPISQGTLRFPRRNHTATFVADGFGGDDMVYVFGGENADGVVSNGELYNATQDIFYESGVVPIVVPGQATDSGDPVYQPHTLHSATLVEYAPGQRYLYLIGGYEDVAKTKPLRRIAPLHIDCIPTASDIASCWKSVSYALAEPRGGHRAVAMAGDTVLITGGCGAMDGDGCGAATSEVLFLFDQTNDQGQTSKVVSIGFTEEAPLWPRVLPAALRLQSEQVLVVGGAQKKDGTVSLVQPAELYNPVQ